MNLKDDVKQAVENVKEDIKKEGKELLEKEMEQVTGGRNDNSGQIKRG
ncbi:MAG: hypothetical protein K6B41_08705 [Butyrivibrio sp.]|nr:hypothetical protein [Butyrivibrio sp.]